MEYSNSICTGCVISCDNSKNFGFIQQSKSNRHYFFHIEKREMEKLKEQGIIEKIHTFSAGDEVEFKVRPSVKFRNQLEAYEVKFLRNPDRDQLVKESLAGHNLYGYLKETDGKFYIKHQDTYITLPVAISRWEVNLASVYTARRSKLVGFRLVTENPEKLRVTVLGREFCPEYKKIVELIISGEPTPALLTGRHDKGFFAKIFDRTIDAFVPVLEVGLTPLQLELRAKKLAELTVGDTVLMKIGEVFSNRQVSLSPSL